MIQKKRVCFRKNDEAVLDLPLRLTVSIVIGMIALVAILSYICNPCLVPQKMVVAVTPHIVHLSGNDPENISVSISVNDTNHHPISGAAVILKGLGGASSGYTDENGGVILIIQVHLESGLSEGYLDVVIQVVCHDSFDQKDMIKVVKTR